MTKKLKITEKTASEFTQIIPMTDDEYGNKASNQKIYYEFYDSPFDEIIVASTSKGVCYMAFDKNHEEAFSNMKSRFYNSEFVQKKTEFQTAAMSIFDLKNSKPIKLHMKGTEFQLAVWIQLLKIPIGKLVSYHMIADDLKMPTASRAIGTAIGRNPIAYIVPCHRVIQSGGNFGGYMWGNTRKMAITAWESGFKYRT
ncbi:MAG: methylated-DNA--[protein]-cysteine S-methyltransferase [Weeksellaceae bacterium]